MATRLEGTVTRFDEQRGLGEITLARDPLHAGYTGIADDPQVRVAFHCTQIADGSRTIALGARVSFLRTPGLAGRWEAAAIRVQ